MKRHLRGTAIIHRVGQVIVFVKEVENQTKTFKAMCELERKIILPFSFKYYLIESHKPIQQELLTKYLKHHKPLGSPQIVIHNSSSHTFNLNLGPQENFMRTSNCQKWRTKDWI